jgi:acylglycerol lipase
MVSKPSLFVFSLVLVGHGKSEGERAFIDDYKNLIVDVLQFVDLVCLRFPGQMPKFLLGCPPQKKG